jgi:hypothetical protein
MKREPFTLDRFLLYMKFCGSAYPPPPEGVKIHPLRWRGMLRFFQTHYQ